MGKTQQAFAVEILGTAITTVARYETSHPPRGEVLLRLADIAAENQLLDLRDEFRSLYLDEVMSNLKFNLVINPVTPARAVKYGYVILKLEGDEQIKRATRFVTQFTESSWRGPLKKSK